VETRPVRTNQTLREKKRPHFDKVVVRIGQKKGGAKLTLGRREQGSNWSVQIGPCTPPTKKRGRGKTPQSRDAREEKEKRGGGTEKKIEPTADGEEKKKEGGGVHQPRGRPIGVEGNKVGDVAHTWRNIGLQGRS